MLPGRKAYWGSLELHQYPDALSVVRALSPEEPVILNRPHAAARAARFFAEKFPGKSLYAVKANPSPDLLRVLWASGVTHYDVASIAEVRLVRSVLPEATLCFMHPVKTRAAIAEAYRNISAVGATPLAVTNCLNFANPQRPEIMAQITGCLEGMADACRALDFPIVSGNVSLYNESKATGGGSAILPTPAIGAVGLIQDWTKAVGIGFKGEGDSIWLLGGPGTHLGQSSWLRYVHDRQDGTPPLVNLPNERARAEAVRWFVETGKANAVHDISDGGLLVALAEMALAGGIGCTLAVDLDAASAFGEDQGRYVIAAPAGQFLENAVEIGRVGGGTVAGIPLADLRAAHEGFFPALMGS